MQIATGLGLMAAPLQLIAFVLYNARIFKGTTCPNAATWSVWTFLSALNLATFASASSSSYSAEEWMSTIALPCVSTLGTFGTFLYSLIAGKFERVDSTDGLLALGGAIAGIVWLVLHQYVDSTTAAGYANLLVISAVLVSFAPLVRGVVRQPGCEQPLPWAVWTLAYLCLFLNVAIQDSNWFAYVYPGSMVIAHLVVAFLAKRGMRNS